ncbi:hypothetical protein HBI56_162950 [Parastagonospora nodorum]|nr:hypothetical protein HBH53_159750 [Parastagonospora nodorum]KAH4189607.1 hypothetical protein HBH42_133090 [Parastagonospora nodorum]KAH4206729.1 hypothetical protein HBI95_119750 [Parastagonospora nodorum]KAH4253723.1 hypothetical protein HBI03_192660 [Parastagonospora nodorum]KAH4254511.1 hypothetical protein HBI04_237520 [Parastagonospora nodorum]
MTIVLPIITYHRAIDAPRSISTGSLKLHVKKQQPDKMGVAPAPHQKKSAPTTKERRAKTPKVNKAPNSRVRSKARSTASAQKSRSRVGPGTRDGASKNRPITIDDDDDAKAEEALSRRADFMQDGYLPSSTAPSCPSFYQPQSPALAVRRTSAPGRAGVGSLGKTYAATSPKAPYEPMSRSMGIYAEAAISVARRRTQPFIRPNLSSNRRDDLDGASFDLNNISDFNTRKDVAQLMAVAPGLPIQDLHDMLLELGGDFAAAKRQAIRRSRAPSARPPVKHGPPSFRAPPQQVLSQESDDGDEVMIKIDPNLDFLEWDSDAPPEPDLTSKRSAPKKSKPAKPGPTKSRPKVSYSGPNSRSSISVRRAQPRPRGGSINRSFIVPDNFVELESDASSAETERSDSTNDTDAQMGGTVPEDVEDLRINMRPQYSYNSRELEKAKGKRR